MTEHVAPLHHPSCPHRFPTVSCFECGRQHQAELSHVGSFGEGWVYAVVCTEDDLTSYYTTEGLDGTCVCPPAERTAEDMALDVQAHAAGGVADYLHRQQLVTDALHGLGLERGSAELAGVWSLVIMLTILAGALRIGGVL